MADRIVEDGVATDRATHTTVIERRSGGGAGMALIGLAVLIAVVIGAFYLFNQNARENAKTNAVTSAASSVGDAAKDVGDAAKDAAK
ncbi:hypothetical protein SAMN03159338_3347 [Sphingomonas sp. NFR04]|jgi:hypothetical protein|uniref:hypothetical protein n=1 Tax=unclassified Sphingomonas TaxID=196159 RepID=UPI0008E537B9|nr:MULTISPECIES: hypothetical protein [unclassified Sphingomonas]SFK13476.1 hypothetical protein SAMN03159338_3347 [Sphingomonas sp. NFR04]